MSELVRVAVDAMGGDHAPEAVVQGVVDALNVSKEIEVLLVGDHCLFWRHRRHFPVC